MDSYWIVGLSFVGLDLIARPNLWISRHQTRSVGLDLILVYWAILTRKSCKGTVLSIQDLLRQELIYLYSGIIHHGALRPLAPHTNDI